MYYYERLDNETTHLMRAIYDDNSLTENYHQSMAGWNSKTDYAISQLDQNRETVWHAISVDYLVYFQHNLTNMDLIGSKVASSQILDTHVIGMDVIDGIVCIVYNGTMLIVNATTQDVIQLYTLSFTYNSLMISGHINIIGCSSSIGPYCTHDQIPTNFGYNDLLNLNILSTYNYSRTNGFSLTNKTLENRTVTIENPSIYTPNEDTYTIQIQSNESYAMSLSDSFDHNLTVSPGQNMAIDLPCRLDDFNSSLSCEQGDNQAPSWVTIDCANSQVLIQETNEFGNDSYSFSVTSTYLHGQIVSTFNIALVACDDINCISCPNRQCTNCSTGYQLNDNTSSCVFVPLDCTFGYDWSNDILKCNPDPTICPSGQQWNDDNSSCVPIPQNCSLGEEWNNSTLSCVPIDTDCSSGEQWDSATLSCILIPNNCDPGYQLSDDRSSCIKINSPDDCVFGPNYTSTLITIIIQAVTCTGVCVCFILAFIGCDSAQDAWEIIHFLQLVLILPLVAKSMNKKIREFIVSNTFVALSTFSLPLCTVKSIPIVKNLSFDQPDEYLKNLGLFSGSTLVNIIILLMIFFVLVFLHLILCFLLYLTKNRETRLSSILSKTYRFFTFTVYIRILVEIYMLMCLMLVSEIKYYVHIEGDDVFGHQKQSEGKTAKGNYVSLILSCIILFFTLSFLLLAFISWTRNKDKMIIDQSCKTRVLYNGLLQIPKRYVNQFREIDIDEIQNSETMPSMPWRIKIARLHSLIFLTKRLMIVLIVVLIPNSLFSFKISLLLILQTISFIVHASSIRSFDKIKDQMVEIFNEAVFLCLLNIVFKYNEESKWNDTTINVFIGLILFHSCTLLFVITVSTIMKIVKCESTDSNDPVELDSEEVEIENLEGNNNINNESSEVPAMNIDQSKHKVSEDFSYHKRRVTFCQEIIEEDKEHSNEIHN